MNAPSSQRSLVHFPGMAANPPTTVAAGLTPVRPIVIAGPSGSGKSTLLGRLFAEFPNQFGFSVSRELIE